MANSLLRVVGVIGFLVSSVVVATSTDHKVVSIGAEPAANPDFFNRDRLGHHLIIDLFNCNTEKLKYVGVVEEIMLRAAQAAHATVVSHEFHQFNPTGVSGAVILAESHIAIHTWPEIDGYCAIDIFTCGKTNNFAALDLLKAEFEAKGSLVVDLDRGAQSGSLALLNENTRIFRENLDPLQGFKTTIAIKDRLELVESEYQRVEMYDTHAVGKMLTIDGIIQCTEYDEKAYHEMIVHVPLQAHSNPRKVLIVGGGDGGALSQLVKYEQLDEIVVCDIDPSVREVAGKYFTSFAQAYNDPRVRAVYQDGAAFVQKFKDYFDVIIVDSTDFYGAAQSLTRDSFYNDLKNALKQDGIVVAQAESLYYDREFIAHFYKQTRGIFNSVYYYHTLVPTYPSGTIGFLFATNGLTPLENLGKSNQELRDLEYYTYDMHRAAFAQPAFLQKLLAA